MIERGIAYGRHSSQQVRDTPDGYVARHYKSGRHRAPEDSENMGRHFNKVDVTNYIGRIGTHHVSGQHRALEPQPEAEIELAPVLELVPQPEVEVVPEPQQKVEIKAEKRRNRLFRRLGRVAAVAAVATSIFAHPFASHSSEKLEATASAASIVPEMSEVAEHFYDTDPILATEVAQLTGPGTESAANFGVTSADLGFTTSIGDGKFLTMFGDTFTGDYPGEGVWRSQTALVSDTVPGPNTPIQFDSALGVEGNGMAPELVPSAHDTSGNSEMTKIPTGIISIPQNKDDPTKPSLIMFNKSVRNWDATEKEAWVTNSAGIAVSYDGINFIQTDLTWENDADNNDPYQMVSAQLDGDYIYMVSNKAGRQTGPVMLRRVHVNDILNQDAYECWDGSNWGNECKSIFDEETRRGELDLKELSDGTWVMAYLKLYEEETGKKPEIVTRFAESPIGPWSPEKTQITWGQVPYLYGGIVHPASTPEDMTFIVSSWRPRTDNDPGRYDVHQFHNHLWRDLSKLS